MECIGRKPTSIDVYYKTRIIVSNTKWILGTVYGIQADKYALSDKDFEKEQNLRINTTKFNGYDKETILRLIKKKHKRSKNISNVSTLEEGSLKMNKIATIKFILQYYPTSLQIFSKIWCRYSIVAGTFLKNHSTFHHRTII